MSDEPVTAEQEQEPKKAGRGGCVALVLAPVLLVAACLSWVSSNNSADDGEDHSKVACREWVKVQLKSPASAEFSNEVVLPNGDTRYEVTGNVDSENSFGAMIRNRYRCLVGWDGEETSLVDINVTNN